MSKAKNPKSCKLTVGDRVEMNPDYTMRPRKGTHVRRASGGASFVVRWDGDAFDNYYYRYELLADLTPTEPEEYESFFV